MCQDVSGHISKYIVSYGDKPFSLNANAETELSYTSDNTKVAEVSDAVWLYDLDEISPQTLFDIVLTLNETSPESLDFHTREIPFATTIGTPYLRYILAFRYC